MNPSIVFLFASVAAAVSVDLNSPFYEQSSVYLPRNTLIHKYLPSLVRHKVNDKYGNDFFQHNVFNQQNLLRQQIMDTVNNKYGDYFQSNLDMDTEINNQDLLRQQLRKTVINKNGDNLVSTNVDRNSELTNQENVLRQQLRQIVSNKYAQVMNQQNLRKPLINNNMWNDEFSTTNNLHQQLINNNILNDKFATIIDMENGGLNNLYSQLVDTDRVSTLRNAFGITTSTRNNIADIQKRYHNYILGTNKFNHQIRDAIQLDGDELQNFNRFLWNKIRVPEIVLNTITQGGFVPLNRNFLTFNGFNGINREMIVAEQQQLLDNMNGIPEQFVVA